MTWEQVTYWQWHCDGCGHGHQAEDDQQPEDWIHTMAGRDLCPRCQA